MLMLADNDVGGAVARLRRVLESDEWAELAMALGLRFVEFEDVGLTRDASDHAVWHRCQQAGAVLITGDRASGTASLEQAIRDHAQTDSLPVVTIGDPQRVIREAAYGRECAISLLDLMDRIEALRGTGRLFIPWWAAEFMRCASLVPNRHRLRSARQRPVRDASAVPLAAAP